MAFCIEREETVEEAIQRIATEQIDGALAELGDDELDVHETIHEVRKRCKKVRGLARLVRGAMGETYRKENAWFRDSARTLSELRDRTALLECWHALLKRYEADVDKVAFRSMGRELEEYRDESFEKKEVEGRLAAFGDRMRAARKRIREWRLDADGFAAMGDGMVKTYKRARKAMRTAYQSPSVESFHEWRKRVKYHRYHNRLLEGVWQPVVSGRRDEVKHLSDLLGDEHDLAVLRATLVGEGDRFGDETHLQVAIGLAENRRKELQAWAMPLGKRVFAEKTKAWRNRMESFWEAWRAEQDLAGALGKRSRKAYG